MGRKRNKKFVQKLFNRNDFHGSYLQKVCEQAISLRTPMGIQLQLLANSGEASHAEASLRRLKNGIQTSESSRRTTYASINPDLDRNILYSCNVPEYARLAATRIRLSSHYLRIETGRWSRLAKEERLCPCGLVQTEEHELLRCPMTADLRDQCPLVSVSNSISDLFSHTDYSSMNELCSYMTAVLNVFL